MYRTTISSDGLLKVKELRDYATVYINGKQIGTLDRRIKKDTLVLNHVPKDATLDILVENNGRINYGPFLTDNRHGITEQVTVNEQPVSKWKQYRLPFSDLKGLNYASKKVKQLQPAMYKGSFTLNVPGDTYLDMSGFGKGFVFLNGYNLGKYWEIGPQQTIYIPSVWLKKGKNEIVVFDQLKAGHKNISTLSHPVIDQHITKNE